MITITSLIFTDLEPTEDPTPMDADDHMDVEQLEVEQLTAAEVVQARLQQGNLSDESISINSREIHVDEVEEQLVQQYECDGYKCDYGPKNSPCCTVITVERYRSVQNDMVELTRDKLDLVIMEQVMAGCRTEESTQCGQKRTQTHTTFLHNSSRYECFFFLFFFFFFRGGDDCIPQQN